MSVDYAEPLAVSSSDSPQLPHVHVSSFCPKTPNGPGSSLTAVRRKAGSPQAGQGFPAAPFGFTSSAASRFSSASMREGASRTRFHSGHLSNNAKISERIANVVS